MSSYLSDRYIGFNAYTPGEQPQDRQYIKLNTNESPFPPSPFAQRLARMEAGDLQLYSDPTVKKLVNAACEKFSINEDEIIFTNGSDEVLSFIFLAYCDKFTGAAFPDVTYGFYSVLSDLYGIDHKDIPLNDDFTINSSDYLNSDRTVFIANPNAQTGIYLDNSEIEKIVKSSRGIVVVDEAYIDFGNESAYPLTKKYDNLIVVRTFSKSRSLAGGRLGFAIADKKIIEDLNMIRYSLNPYNVNKMTMMAGVGALIDEDYFNKNCKAVIKTREFLISELRSLGFTVTDSKANFVLAKHGDISGEDLYLKLKDKGILVRHFSDERISDYVRITVGSDEQIKEFLRITKEILDETE